MVEIIHVIGRETICPSCGERLQHYVNQMFRNEVFFCGSCNNKFPVKVVGTVYEVIEDET